MKTLSKTLVLVIAFCVCGFTSAKLPTYTLTEAIQKKLISVQIMGADQTQPNSSSHYGKCMQIELTNTTSQSFKIKLAAGQQFEPDDSAIQNMMVTEGVLFVLTPKKQRKEYINAMCVQHHDGGPNSSVKFTMGSMSNGHLLGIAQLVEKHKYFNSTAQNAVWCISDGEDISTIQNDEDTVMTYVLQKFVSEATGQPIPTRHKQVHAQPAKRYSKTTVTFEWSTHDTYTTTLVVLDMQNKPVMEILKDVGLPAGEHSQTIVLNEADLPKGYYKIILYLNNKPQMTRKVKLGR